MFRITLKQPNEGQQAAIERRLNSLVKPRIVENDWHGDYELWASHELTEEEFTAVNQIEWRESN
jgi:hypothetical protein